MPLNRASGIGGFSDGFKDGARRKKWWIFLNREKSESGLRGTHFTALDVPPEKVDVNCVRYAR